MGAEHQGSHAETFEDAVAAVATLTKDPGAATKLVLYGLYKQATVGDVTGAKPGLFNLTARAKYDAWASMAGTSREDAAEEYLLKVNELLSAE